MKKITSKTNTEIKAIVALHQSKERKKTGLFIAEGKRVIKTLIDSKPTLEKLLITSDLEPFASSIAPIEKIVIVSDEIMRKISAAKTPSGILGVFKIPQQPAWDELSSGLVLAKLADPGNVGTLIRSAAAMGKKSVVLIDSVDPYNPKVIQSTAGTIANVQIFRTTWQELVNNKQDLKLCALVVSDGKKPHEMQKENLLLVVGSEAHGIPQEWLQGCDEKMTIEMPGKTESLNAAVAGSIALYLTIAS